MVPCHWSEAVSPVACIENILEGRPSTTVTNGGLRSRLRSCPFPRLLSSPIGDTARSQPKAFPCTELGLET